MSLVIYRKKRSFDQTPEPKGGKSSAKQFRFVIQEHHARRLHYDFRLEMDGVLKSWAVPKRPSMDPKDKRLAVQVEDHPIDYMNFEGEIPKGNYGAGTVIRWDHGHFSPAEDHGSRKKNEAALLKELRKGELHVILKGKKLKGAFTLVRLKDKPENWLLIKQKPKGKTVASASRKAVGKKKTDSSKKKNATTKKIKSAKRNAAAKPTFIPPMLATLADSDFVPDRKDWIYETKWDGYRVVAVCSGKEVHLLSRNEKSFDARFYPVRDALASQQWNAVLDGEIVASSSNEPPRFELLQRWQSEKDGDLSYHVFDLLQLDGHDLTNLTLIQRRELLETLLEKDPVIHLSKEIKKTGAALLQWGRKHQLEGIMAKRANSLYSPGLRSDDWLKIKLRQNQEVVIVGFLKKEDSDRSFSSLLAAVYDNKQLLYTGKIGTGFTQKEEAALYSKLKKLQRKTCPLEEWPAELRRTGNDQITWVRPQLVAVVEYAEITRQGLMRQASFQGLRDDKKATDVHPEKKAGKINQRTKAPEPIADQPSPFSNATSERMLLTVNGHELEFTHLSRKYWPAEKYSKADLLDYYYQVAPLLLHYIQGRAQSLHRFPGGIKGKGFYQKDVTGKVPDWMRQAPYTTGKGDKHHFLIPQSEAELLYMVNWGCIEINPANDLIDEPGFPTWCLLDIDPGTKSSFDDAIDVANTIHDILSGWRIQSYPKTSGATGLHIYLPLQQKYSFDECQLFAKLVALEAEKRLPSIASTERMVKNRGGKLYIDYLQNRPGATLAAPYSVRPRPGAPVSMPLDWSEIKKGLKPVDFTIKNALVRIEKNGDLFKPVLGKAINLKEILEHADFKKATV